MAKVVRGQRDLIDFAEVQHQDIEAELRRQIETDAEYIRQLRIMVRALADGVLAHQDQAALSVLSLKAKELLGY